MYIMQIFLDLSVKCDTVMFLEVKLSWDWSIRIGAFGLEHSFLCKRAPWGLLTLDFRPQAAQAPGKCDDKKVSGTPKSVVFWKSWHQLDQPPSGAGVQAKKKDHNSLPFPKSSVIFVLASTSCCSNSYWAAFNLTDEHTAPFVSALRTVLWEMKPIHK